MVAYRQKYLAEFKELRKRSRVYVGDNLEQSTPVDPEKLGDKRETFFVYHDESTVHAKERPRLSWLLPGTTELRSKDQGRLIHISDFICETTGRLIVTPDQIHGLQSNGHQTVIPTIKDAAVVIYPGTKGDP